MKDDADNDSVVQLLNQLRPVAPSPEFLRRLADSCPALTSEAPAATVRIFPRVLAIAAVFAVGGAAVWIAFPDAHGDQDTAGLVPPAPTTEITAVRYLAPQESSRQLLGVRDLGICRDAQSRPVRLMRATWLDDSIYSQGDGKPALREAELRDEIIPVLLTTY